MANDFSNVTITDRALEIPSPALRADAGAVVDFLGVVRGLEDGREIKGIDYEANREMAEHQMRKIADEARERFGFATLQLHHRIGFVPVAEASLFVRIMARHRGPALDACRWIIERLKEEVPIWKRTVENGLSS